MFELIGALFIGLILIFFVLSFSHKHKQSPTKGRIAH